MEHDLPKDAGKVSAYEWQDDKNYLNRPTKIDIAIGQFGESANKGYDPKSKGWVENSNQLFWGNDLTRREEVDPYSFVPASSDSPDLS